MTYFETYRGKNIYFDKWMTYNGKTASAYVCKDFNYYPYYNISFAEKNLEDLKTIIDDMLDNYDAYVDRFELMSKSCAEFYKDQGQYKGD